jgi:spore coat polysaccharide biosynthesis predicted glycosyltransferase SpsG
MEEMQTQSLTAEPGSVADAGQTHRLASALGAEWVVVDGYQFGTAFQKALKQEGLSLLTIDDYGHSDRYYADFVLNQNLHATEALYGQRETSTRLLLGTDYALLRREFIKCPHHRRAIPRVAQKVLVTMGGADPENITEIVVRALDLVPIDGLEAVIVVGGSNPHLDTLRSAVTRCRLRPELRVNVTDMAVLMTGVDAAVTAGGSSVWELALLGVPALGIGRAHQEVELLRGAAATGIIVDLGFYRDVSPTAIAERLSRLLLDSEERTRLADAARARVDGRGSERVIRAMRGQERGLARA